MGREPGDNMKKAKELNEFFGPVFTGKICLQKSQVLGPEGKSWARKSFPWWRWIRLGNIWTNCAYRSPWDLREWAHESWGSQLMSLWCHSQRITEHLGLEGTSGGHLVPLWKIVAIRGRLLKTALQVPVFSCMIMDSSDGFLKSLPLLFCL